MIDHMKAVREFAMRRRLGQGVPVDTSTHWVGTCRKCGNTVNGTRAALSKGCPKCSTEGGPHA